MSNLSANAQLLGNLEHTTAELLEGMTEERGRGFASDNESWAALKGYLERAEKMRKDIIRDLSFMSYAPFIFISALTGQRVLVTPRRGTPRAAQVQGIDDECKLVVRFDGESRPAALNSGEVSVRLL